MTWDFLTVAQPDKASIMQTKAQTHTIDWMMKIAADILKMGFIISILILARN